MGGGSLGRDVGVRKSRVSLVLLLSLEPELGLRFDMSKPSLWALSSFSISSRSSNETFSFFKYFYLLLSIVRGFKFLVMF